MTRAYDDRHFAAFGEAPSPLSPVPAPLAEVDPALWKFGQDEQGAGVLKLGMFAAFNFVLVLGLCLGLWALLVTGGVSAADLGTMGREILGALKLWLSHLSLPSPTLPPTA